MARVSYSRAAIRDLEEIGDYVAERLKNPIAALNTVNKIQDAIDNLGEFPLMGAPLSSISYADTDYRFLVCGSYLAFYRLDGEAALVDRILYGKRDYLSVLFGGFPANCHPSSP